MATPLPAIAGSAHNPNENLSASIIDFLGFVVRETGYATPPPDRDWLLEVATSLQTTLDVEALVPLFSQHARRVVPHDSVRYDNARAGVQVNHGEPAEHTVVYDLVLLDQDLGRIGFSRHQPFGGAETLALENILCNFIHPLRNSLMYREALLAAARDPLTGLNNRVSLERVLDREIELSRRHATSLSVLMIDADSFKAVNDDHGHLVGDVALRLLAGCISQSARDSDMVFRYGGEEFVAVLSNTGLRGAANLAERIRRTVKQAGVIVEQITMSLTVSVGVAELADGETRNSLLSRADAALYTAKRNGRDRVEIADAPKDAVAKHAARVAAGGNGRQASNAS